MMANANHLEDIREQGWTDAVFLLSESERADYARLANILISIALEDDEVRGSLRLELNPGLEAGTVRAGTFGLGSARNSADDKVYLHTGFQSRVQAERMLPERKQPKLMRDFWEANDAILDEVQVTTESMLRLIDARGLRTSIFPSDRSRRNVHLRTVRYTAANAEPVGREVVSGHADLGLMTLHLYETHGGWFYATPYPAELIRARDSPSRREDVRTMRGNLRMLPQTPDHAPFFLGANWQTFSSVPEHLRDLPACYHAGFRPAIEVVSPYAQQVTGRTEDRVSVISFLHPNGDLLKNGIYQPATVSNCRPEYGEV